MNTKHETSGFDSSLVEDCDSLLEELVSQPSPGTFEDAAQKVVARHLAQCCDRIETDLYGNVIGAIEGGFPTRLMLTAHVDEICMLISHIDDNGFIWIAPLGGVRPDALVGQRVVIHSQNGAVPGVIGRNPGPAPKTEILISDLWVDIGVDSREAAEALVALGDTATVDAGYQRLAGNRVAGRALDDRAGVAAVVAAMRIIAEQRDRLQVDVFALSATQEEGGQHRGATTGTYALQPHVCLAVDLCHATDAPNRQPRAGGANGLDGGPVVSISLTTNREVNRRLAEAAKTLDIPLQYAVEPRLTGTDGDRIASSRSGVATSVVSISSRYMHSPAEVVSLADIAMTARLLAEFALQLPANPDFRPLANLI